ncbi:thiopeptide-type bacteriocin biosynthesis protein [Bacillaceae bacterium Marseille-Q3522]|nr:thiopeptide-type bacteriocin biosynthesis protein [Bacillaceae bacterium Marseille-Q3522]
MTWNSYHIFIHDMTYHDLFLTEYLYPFIQENEETISQYFFIRYWQGGPHIRFRFTSSHPESIFFRLQMLVEAFKSVYKPAFPLTKEGYYKNHLFDGKKPDESELYWIEDLAIVEIKYEPEFERYGGKSLIGYSERIFQITSDLAFRRLNKNKDHLSPTMKLIFACDFFTSMRAFLHEKQITRLLENYEKFWSAFMKAGQMNEKYVAQVSRLFRDKTELIRQMLNDNKDTHLQQIYQIFNEVTLKGKKEVIPSLIFSHVHMFNNRIGLPSYLESSVATIMKSTKAGVNENEMGPVL